MAHPCRPSRFFTKKNVRFAPLLEGSSPDVSGVPALVFGTDVLWAGAAPTRQNVSDGIGPPMHLDNALIKSVD
jgi:hypothetical protein